MPLLAAMALLPAATARAQEPAPGPRPLLTPADAAPVCRPLSDTRDRTDVEVHARLRMVTDAAPAGDTAGTAGVASAAAASATAADSSRRREALRRVLDAIHARFEAPPITDGALGDPVDARRVRIRGSSAAPALASDVRFLLRADGSIDQAAVTLGSGAPALDSALLAALRRLGTDRAAAGLVADLLPEGAAADPARLELSTDAFRDSAAVTRPLLTATLPAHEFLPPRLRPGSPRPTYPDPLRAAGVEGRVVFDIVLDTAGRVELDEVRVVRSAHPLFEAAVRDVLPRLRFHPTRLNGCPVRLRARQSLAFQLSQ